MNKGIHQTNIISHIKDFRLIFAILCANDFFVGTDIIPV